MAQDTGGTTIAERTITDTQSAADIQKDAPIVLGIQQVQNPIGEIKIQDTQPSEADRFIESVSAGVQDIPAEQPLKSDPSSVAGQFNERREILNELGMGDIVDTINKQAEISASQLGEEEAAGIPTLKTQLTDITNKILQRTTAFRRQKEAIYAQGGSKGFVQNQINDLSRREAFEIADLETIRFVRSNSLENAQAMVDRKIQLQLEPLKFRLQAQEFIFNNNKELFSEIENRDFQQRLQERQRKIDKEERRLGKIEDTKLKIVQDAVVLGASNFVIENILRSNSVEDAYKAARGFIANPVSGGAGADGGADEKPLSTNQIEQFRRSYGWTPPFGYTLSQLTQFIEDNPNMTPGELEAAANSVASGGESSTEQTASEVITSIMDNLSDSDLKALKKQADDAGISKWYRGKKSDVEVYLESISSNIQEALDSGFTIEEIIEFLKT